MFPDKLDAHDAGSLQLAFLLQDGKATGLFKLAFARLAFGLLALGVGETRAGLGQHLLLVLVHVDGVRARWLGFWVGVDFTRTKPADVVCAGRCLCAGAGQTELLALLCLCVVEQLLVALEALGGRAADNGSDSAPLGGHELCEMEQLLILGLVL